MTIWRLCSIGELVEKGEADLQTGPFGTQLKASDYVADGIPVINVRNIGFGNIRDAELEYLNEKMGEKLSAHKLRAGDIVFGRKGAVERHTLINATSDGWIQGSDCLRLRISSTKVLPAYLSYFFQTAAHKLWMDAVCSFGATMSSLNQDIVRRITFPFASYEVQRQIVIILSAYDDLIENTKRRIAILEKMAEEIYREWFVRMRFPEIDGKRNKEQLPEGWRFIEIEELIKRIPVGKRYEQKTASPSGKTPILDQGQSGIIGYHDDDPGVVASFSEPVIVFANHTCYQRLIFHPFSAIQNVLPFVPSEENRSDIFWLHYATVGKVELSEYKGHWPAFAATKIAYPGFRITERFGLVVRPLVAQVENLKKQIQVLVQSRDLLLPRLISGELSVEDLELPSNEKLTAVSSALPQQELANA